MRSHLTRAGSSSRPSVSLNKILALEDFLKMEDSPGMSSGIVHVLQTEVSGISRMAAAGDLDSESRDLGLIS